jgi:7 transmembrane sweet-taste receptor of 3 GCPR
VLLDHFCASDRLHRTWQFISLGAQCFLLLVASVLAFQTRNLSKGVNEAQTLATLIYSHFVFVGCRFLIFIFETSLGVAVSTQIFSLLYSLDSFATLAIYFLPKLMSGENEESLKREYGGEAAMMRVPGPSAHIDAMAKSGSSMAGFNQEAETSPNTHTDQGILSPCKPDQTGCTDGTFPEPADEEIYPVEESVDVPKDVS